MATEFNLGKKRNKKIRHGPRLFFWAEAIKIELSEVVKNTTLNRGSKNAFPGGGFNLYATKISTLKRSAYWITNILPDFCVQFNTSVSQFLYLYFVIT